MKKYQKLLIYICLICYKPYFYAYITEELLNIYDINLQIEVLEMFVIGWNLYLSEL